MEKTAKYVSIARYVLANIVAEPQRWRDAHYCRQWQRRTLFIG
jgi:hypothetical protein